MKKNSNPLLASATGLALALSSQLPAATISWQPSVDMYQGSTTETFVNTEGTSIVAYNNTTDITSGDTAVTVNGVSFTPQNTGIPLVGVGGATITINGGTDNENAFGDGDFSNNGSIYHLIRGGTFEISSVTLSGLTIGQTYLVQAFNHDGRNSRHNDFITGYDGTSSAPAGTSQLSNYETDGEPDIGGARVGDSIIGTFLADSATQVITIYGSGNNGASWASGNSQSQINAIQLRAIEPIPEPSSALLVGLAGTVLLLRRRK
ncbi:PEP-CTERM sorting domain-containing protein [Roseibacillus persicicus]|uniref:PEP-CTERM sorting domain-containing protein n=1 Tax=Roseibacillus persicicus TaxID=454148 RepID=UPI001675CA2A|nr:PEP-CTERM sorting domain-containing protein [Roseibacillus persicicus]